MPGISHGLSRSGALAILLAAAVVASTPPATAQPLTLPQKVILQQPDGDRDPGDAFGSAVAVWGTRMIVGAPGDDARGPDAGAAYVFVRRDGVWRFEAKLAPTGLLPGDGFGTAVALSDTRAVVGAPGDDIVTNEAGLRIDTMGDRGAAYTFTRIGPRVERRHRGVADEDPMRRVSRPASARPPSTARPAQL